ncbi:D-erythronate dehydrogenase [Breoghania sp.]|uniref:D-erythronate dehydrogenase n=1 Tax=Breoghania sp. TaxID=2065378 RepID=UPI002AAC097A|nr:D-erythronate dehydrogenase [Breoghania sp.]
MTHAFILGAAGMVGARLAAKVAASGSIGGHKLDRLTLADIVEPRTPDAIADGLAVTTMAADIAKRETADAIVGMKPDIIVHLAAVVSGEAEVDFDKGYSVNLQGTLNLLESLRAAQHAPRLVFTSSIAVFGTPFPPSIPDEFHHTPLTSYGTQKAMSELLIADYRRKGLVDAIGIRLPTIVVRPGKPNKAASGFFSGIIREPLNGLEAVLPVDPDVRHWMASPTSAVGYLEHAASLDTDRLGGRPNLTMPGLSVTVREEIECLEKLAGKEAVDLIRHEPDEQIIKMVDGWAQSFDARRALDLGFTTDADFEAIVRLYAEDEGIKLKG